MRPEVGASNPQTFGLKLELAALCSQISDFTAAGG